MKAIIEKGKVDNNIQSCFISECGIEIIFHNNDLADKFTKSLDPSGKVARVENQFSNFCCGISTVFYGEIEPEEGTIYIVSAMVLAAAKNKGSIRKNGFIVSVPGFVR